MAPATAAKELPSGSREESSSAEVVEIYSDGVPTWFQILEVVSVATSSLIRVWGFVPLVASREVRGTFSHHSLVLSVRTA